MSYFALAVARDADGWSAAEVSLADAADLEDVSDRLREVNPVADLSLLFVESDDAYLAILRLDEGEDLRVFGSDVAFAEESRLGALLLGEVASIDIGMPETAPEAGALAVPAEVAVAEAVDVDVAGAAGEGAEAEEAAEVDAAGDLDILADLGVGAAKLLRLCGHEGMLPSDVTTQVCQVLGCADEVEELRGG